jgi:hypothetical protein
VEAAVKKIARYDGTWSEIEFDLRDNEPEDTALERAGFNMQATSEYGIPGAGDVYLTEHDTEARWMVQWSPCLLRVEFIDVVGVAALTELLPKLTAPAAAAMLTSLSRTLEGPVYAAQKRYPLPGPE